MDTLNLNNNLAITINKMRKNGIEIPSDLKIMDQTTFILSSIENDELDKFEAKRFIGELNMIDAYTEREIVEFEKVMKKLEDKFNDLQKFDLQEKKDLIIAQYGTQIQARFFNKIAVLLESIDFDLITIDEILVPLSNLDSFIDNI